VLAWAAEARISEEDAALWQVLEEQPEPCAEVKALREAARGGQPLSASDERSAWLSTFARRVLGARGEG
jgi:hypothetical protein